MEKKNPGAINGFLFARRQCWTMVSLDAFRAGDVYIDYPYEEVKFRFEKKTGKAYGRFYGEAENEIDRKSGLYHDAISAGKLITREEYYRD